MEVILLEKVRNLGSLGDKVKVAAGYGRNYLIRYGKAEPATAANLEKFETRRAELEKIAKEQLSLAEGRKEKIEALTVTIPAKSGDEGKLFGSIGTKNIADAVTEAGLEVSKAEVALPNGAIRNVGDYEIELQLHTDVTATLKISVVPEE